VLVGVQPHMNVAESVKGKAQKLRNCRVALRQGLRTLHVLVSTYLKRSSL